jgi:ABC-type transport system involved in multi-copper enzyme maturation permease subunit
MWTRDFETHNYSHSIWAWLGVPEYGWYLWSYLYVYFLQQVWALFAVLLAFDGLIREKFSGTVAFSLGLPVSRKRWLFSRLAVVLMESAALSLFAVLVVIVGSAVIHQTFSLSQMFLHAALMVAAGVA